ncbi:MAG: hypothetical protein KUG82_10310 [Pseudomonadales bacterium]|nr:hypothetical protein [Pseudomonadales bacterium]
MDSSADRLQLKIPQQDLRKLSFCGHTRKKIEQWVEGLPKVNVGETARQLYAAIQELNRLQIDPLNRYQLLEALRPSIHYVCDSLAKHYLNQSIVLPDKANKVANLAQALQNHLAMGYKIAVSQGTVKIKDNGVDQMVASAIHRALCDLSYTLLRCYQLYFPTPANLWRELHRLYLLAEHHQLLDYEIEDSELDPLKSSCIHHAYLSAILIATAKPNQLRQQEIALIYQATTVWSKLTKIGAALDDSHLFVVNLASDSAPVYASLIANKEKSQYYRYIECGSLATQLKDILRTPDHYSKDVKLDLHLPHGFHDDLLRHLIQSWGQLTERSFSRSNQTGHINICLGHSATHYYLANKTDFNTVLRGFQESGIIEEDENPFLNTSPFDNTPGKNENTGDIWSLAFDSNSAATGTDLNKITKISLTDDAAALNQQANQNTPPLFESYRCGLINTSPGGFCVAWGDKVPKLVKTGEIVGMREDNQEVWSIGVIRWVKQFKNEGARMGIELLAPDAIPVGTKVLNKVGVDTEYMRALLLPELKAIGQTATLITPKIAFHVGNKIYLNEQGSEDKAQLIRQVTSTASFSQFQFRYINKPTTKPKKPDPDSPLNKDSDFDSIWTSL